MRHLYRLARWVRRRPAPVHDRAWVVARLEEAERWECPTVAGLWAQHLTWLDDYRPPFH